MSFREFLFKTFYAVTERSQPRYFITDLNLITWHLVTRKIRAQDVFSNFLINKNLIKSFRDGTRTRCLLMRRMSHAAQT
jgi:hypothetical protein